MMSQDQQPEHDLDQAMLNIVGKLAPLVPIEAKMPDNPWNSGEYAEKLKAAHALLDGIKEGNEVLIIAINQKNRNYTHSFIANMETSEALVRATSLASRLANLALKDNMKDKDDIDLE